MDEETIKKVFNEPTKEGDGTRTLGILAITNENCTKEFFQFLVEECKVDPTGKRMGRESTPLHYAAQYDNLEVFKYLLEKLPKKEPNVDPLKDEKLPRHIVPNGKISAYLKELGK